MPTPVPHVSDSPTVQQHYAVQLGLMTALEEAAAGIDLSQSNEVFASLVREFQSAAISLSADYYLELRGEANVVGAYSPPVLDPWAPGQLEAYLDAATADLLEEIEREAQAVAIGQRLTLDSGIAEIYAAMDNEPPQVRSRVRWARVTRPDACSFCLLLASRGAVYRSEESGDFRAHVRFNGSGGTCRCGVEAVFTEYEPAAHIEAAQSLYAEATDNSMTPAEKRNAFRRALAAERSTAR